MTFISMSEDNNKYFTSGKAMDEILIFFTSQNEIDVIFMTKKCVSFCIKYNQMIVHMKSTIIKYDIIFMMAYKHRSRKDWCNENEFFSKVQNIF